MREYGSGIESCCERDVAKSKTSSHCEMKTRNERCFFINILFFFQPVAAFVRLEPFYIKAETEMRNHRWANAIAIYRKILEAVNPDDFTSLRGLAKCLLENKSHRYAEACVLLQRVCAAHPDFDVLMLLSEACWRNKDWDQSLSVVKKAASFLSQDCSAQQKKEHSRAVSVAAAKALLGKVLFCFLALFYFQLMKTTKGRWESGVAVRELGVGRG
jgi:tetratricopeptide (TPR) repeat protein